MYSGLSSVSVPFESEPQLQDVVVEVTLEAMLPRVVPFPVHHLEGYVLGRREGVAL